MGWLDLAVLSAPPKLHLGFLSVSREGPSSLVYTENGTAAEKRASCVDGGSAVDAEMLLIHMRVQRRWLGAALLILMLLNNSCHCGVSVCR